MKRIVVSSISIIAVFAACSLAQSIDKAQIQSAQKDYLDLRPAVKPFSLIDLSRIKWSHSYSVSFFSGGGTSGSVGLYTGSIFYEFTPKLSLDLSMGIAHNPGAMFNRGEQTDATFYPSMSLDYHPSEHFRLSVGFASYPGLYYNPYYPYREYEWRDSRR